MGGNAKVVWLMCLFGVFVSDCEYLNVNGTSHYSKDKPKHEKSIKCYECNSKYDPRCGDPFDPFAIGTVNCSLKVPPEHLKTIKPTLCRKIVQKIEGKVRIIRGCGYLPHPRDNQECIRRTGTHEVEVHYCSCTGDLCNLGFSTTRPSNYAILLSSLAMVAVTCLLRIA